MTRVLIDALSPGAAIPLAKVTIVATDGAGAQRAVWIGTGDDRSPLAGRWEGRLAGDGVLYDADGVPGVDLPVNEDGLPANNYFTVTIRPPDPLDDPLVVRIEVPDSETSVTLYSCIVETLEDFGMLERVDGSGAADAAPLVYDDASSTWVPGAASLSELTRDAIAAAVTEGANIEITTDDGADTITIAVTGLTSAELSDFAEAVRDRVGTTLDGFGLSVTADDSGDTIIVAPVQGGQHTEPSRAWARALATVATRQANVLVISDSIGVLSAGFSSVWAGLRSLYGPAASSQAAMWWPVTGGIFDWPTQEGVATEVGLDGGTTLGDGEEANTVGSEQTCDSIDLILRAVGGAHTADIYVDDVLDESLVLVADELTLWNSGVLALGEHSVGVIADGGDIEVAGALFHRGGISAGIAFWGGGISGESSAEWVTSGGYTDMCDLLVAESRDPDLVLIYTDTGDGDTAAEMVDAITTMVAAIRASCTDYDPTIVHVIPPVHANNGATWETTYVPAFKQMHRDLGLVAVDLVAAIGDIRTGGNAEALSSDQVHFNGTGNAVMTQVLLDPLASRSVTDRPVDPTSFDTLTDTTPLGLFGEVDSELTALAAEVGAVGAMSNDVIPRVESGALVGGTTSIQWDTSSGSPRLLIPILTAADTPLANSYFYFQTNLIFGPAIGAVVSGADQGLWPLRVGVPTAAGNAVPMGAVTTNSGTTRTLALGDMWCQIRMTNASASTVTLPTNAAVAIPAGARIWIGCEGAGGLTVVGDTGVTVNGTSGGSVTAAQWELVFAVKVASNIWRVVVGTP